jgi:hypothetical protein
MKINPSLEGVGRYDVECQAAFEACQAQGVLLIVCNGKYGHGFSAIMTPDMADQVPAVLRDVASQLEKNLKQSKQN